MLAGGGTLELGLPAKSMPNGLRAKFYGVTSPADRYALLEKDLGVGKSVRCDFDIYVNQRPNMDVVDVFRIRTRGPGVGDYILYLAVTTGGGSLADDISYADASCACPQKYVPFTKLHVASWSHVTVETDFATAKVTVDGTVVVNDTFGPINPTDPIVVGLGGRAFSSITSDVSFDDFSCTLSP